MHSLKMYEELAFEAAKKAGDFILTCYGNAKVTMKTDLSPVTEADIGAHTIICSLLKETGIPILSEEEHDLSQIPVPYPERLWIVDPLDGTKNFIDNSPDFAVMIGLIDGGRPILGMVYAPALFTSYTASRGSGAFVIKDGARAPLQVSARNKSDTIGLRSKNHFTPFMERVMRHLDPKETHVRGSIGIKAGIIAEGEADFFFNPGKLGAWDVCAPQIILEEAGGMVTDMENKPLFYGTIDHRIQNGAIFSNGVMHQAIRDAVENEFCSTVLY